MEEYIMIGFSIMMWFSSALLIFFSISLLKGNYSSVHGKVFETTNDKNGYAKALGKPVLLIGICVLLSGVIAVVLPKDYAISIAVVFILFIAVVAGIRFKRDFRKFQFYKSTYIYNTVSLYVPNN
jgi:hypothetical protein